MIICKNGRVGIGGDTDELFEEYAKITDAMCRMARSNVENGMSVLRRLFEEVVKMSTTDEFVKERKVYETIEEFEKDMLKKEEEA